MKGMFVAGYQLRLTRQPWNTPMFLCQSCVKKMFGLMSHYLT